MIGRADHVPAGGVQVPPIDTSGQDRMVSNVAFSWLGHTVVLAAGFMMPRLLDRHLGQQQLGVWDFSWSVVGYFGLFQIGLGSSINRFVARHRSQGGTGDLCCTVSSGLAVQGGIATAVFLATCIAAWLVPRYAGTLGADANVVRWVVFLLGASCAVQTATDTFRGVITGCHRWDVHNALNCGAYAMSVIGMAVVLTAGRGLIAVAAVYATGTLTTEIARWIAARRVCPSLRVSWTAVRWDRISQLVRFGSKTALDDAAALVLTQTNAVAITVFLGPRALALFARPQAICRHLDTLANKLAFVVAPAASALQGAGRTADLRALFVESTRLAMMFALPLVLFVAIMGDILLRVWMGPRYESGGALLSILALGSVLTMGQRPAIQMLVGMNLHGRVAASSVVAVGVALLFVWYAPVHFNLVGCALVVVTPMLVADGMVVPILACRRLGVPLREYIGRVVMQPLASAAPFIGALAISRWCLMRGQTVAASGAVAAGAIVLVCLDWRVVLSRDQRRWVASRLPTWFPAAHLYESAI